MLKLLFTILCLTHFVVFFTTATTTQPLGTSTLVDVTAHACLPSLGLFKTFNQIDLGTPNTAANQFMKTNFARCFGTGGLTLGADVELDLDHLVDLNLNLNLNLLGGQTDAPLQLVFNTVQSLTDFLPQLNPAGILTSVTDLTDPTTCSAGSLAGDLLALNLNAVFDQVFPSFGAADLNLTALVLVKGPCAGLSVGAVIDIASEVLSGVIPDVFAKVKLFTPATIGSCVAAINANFLNGAHVGAFVALPGFNAQANLNVKLPLNLNLDAAVKATLSLQTGVNAAAYLHVVLAGLQADAALTLKNTVYNAWNLDLAAKVNLKANLDVALDLNSCILSSLPSSITGVVDATVDVDLFALVNYVLNFHAGIHASVDVQASILCLLNPSLSVKACVNASGLLGVNLKVVAAIVADARLNGIGFIPAPNQLVGVVAKVKLGSGIFARVLLEVKVPALALNINSKLCIDL